MFLLISAFLLAGIITNHINERVRRHGFRPLVHCSTEGFKAFKEIEDQSDHKEIEVLKDFKGIEVLKVFKEIKDLKENKVFKEFPERILILKKSLL